MHVTGQSDASSFLLLTDIAITTYGLREVEGVTVNIVTLDALIERGKVPLPDLIKLDMQGFEIEVLKRASAALAHAHWVISEVSFEEYYRGQPLFHDIARYLHERGFQVFAFSHAAALGACLTQTDVLFWKRG